MSLSQHDNQKARRVGTGTTHILYNSLLAANLFHFLPMMGDELGDSLLETTAQQRHRPGTDNTQAKATACTTKAWGDNSPTNRLRGTSRSESETNTI